MHEVLALLRDAVDSGLYLIARIGRGSREIRALEAQRLQLFVELLHLRACYLRFDLQ